jgi:cytochrome c-type biogenesis protein
MTSGVGLATAFAGGVVSFLSPCVLPLVPGYVSYVAGDAAGAGEARNAGRAAALGACFVLGFSTVFVLLGASATALGQILLAYRYQFGLVAGAIVIIFGLFLLGFMQPMWLMRERRFHVAIPGGRPLSAYVLGTAFAFGWTPCIGPVLGGILTLGAASATVSGGATLLGVYSLGLGIPFVASAMFVDRIALKLRTFGRAGRLLQLATGGVMVLAGVAMMTGELTTFSYWLLETFPSLSTIG